MTSFTKTLLHLDTSTKDLADHEWRTVLSNCYCHSFDEVVEQLIKAIGCSTATASQLAHTAEQFSNVVVFNGSYEKCEKVAEVLGSIGLDVKVSE